MTAPACCSSSRRAGVFLLPFAHDHLLVGTTDTDYRGDPARCSVLPSEVTYLCEAANRYLRDPIAPDEVVWRSPVYVHCWPTRIRAQRS